MKDPFVSILPFCECTNSVPQCENRLDAHRLGPNSDALPVFGIPSKKLPIEYSNELAIPYEDVCVMQICVCEANSMLFGMHRICELTNFWETVFTSDAR